MELRDFDKEPLSVEDQATRLLGKGLKSERERLERYLRTIGYYRFSIYWRPYLTETKKFKTGTTLDDFLSVYIFDRKLRLTVMEAIERIEVSLRAEWSGTLALHGGVTAYTNENLFKKYHPKKQKFNHEESLRNITTTISKENDEKFIKHHRENYVNGNEPPIWAVAQIMSFGELSKWVGGTIESHTRAEIKSMFCINNDSAIDTVFHTISIVRNICAHHGRLWNRIIKKSPPKDLQGSISSDLITYKDKANQIKVDSHLYNYLVVIEHLLRAINPNSDWKIRLVELLETMDYSHHQQMGFPENWKSREPWKSADNKKTNACCG